MRNMFYFVIPFVIAVLISCSENNVNEGIPKSNSINNDIPINDSLIILDDFVRKNSVIDSVLIDFNLDNAKDYIMVLGSKQDSSYPQEVALLLNVKGKFKEIGRNTNLMFSKNNQGRLGEPYCGILTEKNGFEICQNIDAGNGMKNTYLLKFIYSLNEVTLEKLKIIRTKVEISSTAGDPLELPKEISDTSIISLKRNFNQANIDSLVREYSETNARVR